MALSASDTAFFARLELASFANPFGSERGELLSELSGVPRLHRDPEAVRDHVLAETARRLRGLEGEGHLSCFRGEDRLRLEIAHLFAVYYGFVDALDRCITEQIAAGDSPTPVTFGAELLAELVGRGFKPKEAERYLAIFFQFRRAYYFVAHELVGNSDAMKDLRRHLWNNVVTHDIRWYSRYLVTRMEDFSTLLLGETGTGKGAAARAIGFAGFIPFDANKGTFSESFTKAFVSINLSQFPDALIESELFGHRRGAFTGAVEDHDGVFARCSVHGSIFLDEIGEVSPTIQIKLLRVLQERCFSPVGSRDVCRFRGRIVAATNRPLHELRSPGGLRDDFFFRLSSDVITMPALRDHLVECCDELDELVGHLLQRMTGPAPELIKYVREAIRQSLPEDYHWPGNVRELEQCVRRILLTGNYEPEASVDCGPDTAFGAAVERGEMNVDELLAGYCRLLYERCGNYSEVARQTGLDRRTVRRHILGESSLASD